MPSIPQLSIALSGLDPAQIGLSAGRGPRGGGLVRGMIDWVSRQRGIRGVQIDAAAAGVRPRELDRSGRRDLAALLRRSELACSGLDLFIPPEHFVQAHRIDRAVSAVAESLELAAELSTLAAGAVVTRMRSAVLPVCLILPGETPASVRQTLAGHAERVGVRIADHAWPVHEQAAGESQSLAVGLDPATLLLAQQDPAQVVAQLGARVASARLTDVARGIGAARVAPGSPSGRLDVLAYRVALATSTALQHVVIDLRGVADQSAAIAQVQADGP